MVRSKTLDFIGYEFPSGKGGLIKVVSYNEELKKFKCVCSICSPDKELFPNGFYSAKGHLKKNKNPCACTIYFWNKEQLLLLASRKRENIEFKDVSGNSMGDRYSSKCKDCGYEWNPTVREIIHKNYGCPSCSKRAPISEDVAIERCVSSCKEKGLIFKGFVGEWRGSHNTKIVFECPEHGEHKNTIYKSFIGLDVSCQKCSEYNYFKLSNPSYFYIVKWSNDVHSFLKFGVTNKTTEHRISRQELKTKYKPKIIFSKQFNTGEIPINLERIIHDSFETGIVDKSVFGDGFTETTHIKNLDLIMEKIHSHM